MRFFFTKVADTYHLYIEGVAMIPEGTAFEEVLRDDNIQGAAGLE